MTREGIMEVFLEERVYNEKVNGFRFEYERSNPRYVIVKGKFPLSLARKINSDPENKMRIRVNGKSETATPEQFAINAELDEIIDEIRFKYGKINEDNIASCKKDIRQARKAYIEKMESEGKLDELYIVEYCIDTTEGISHVIRCIREGKYVNQCLF